MKLKSLAIFSTTALLLASCVGGTPSSQSSVPEASPTPAVSTETPMAQDIKPSGDFVAGEHPTQGMVRVVTENGQRYLDFDEAFKTDEGPDLFVLLHREQTPKSYQADNYVNLGELQQVSGTQRYAIPAEVNLADFGSVVIWCRQFNATFGYAALGT
ncbi:MULTISPECIES: DM13 domain-containing protein [unclassified Coleofasciculus]|uniref:DM13 domain-containing protein n=1 Tax=unclassified Coleofasciculus TaxID=2692782 RepID=UPI001882B1D8|nr:MULTISPECIES: DM13 domain-containing protein [unclassified Coleofasciculus]MBE9129065.1 DM13 domain-containing protein [Coleofasciculus sp. LEGE 07081]MBE9151936.1 DM13 domain-containing protein [Coleofasciculus sp. LEGE 07092]